MRPRQQRPETDRRVIGFVKSAILASFPTHLFPLSTLLVGKNSMDLRVLLRAQDDHVRFQVALSIRDFAHFRFIKWTLLRQRSQLLVILLHLVALIAHLLF